MRPLYTSHTAEYICTSILESLQSYEINISQINSVTTDNGANMVRLVKILQQIDEEFDNSCEFAFITNQKQQNNFEDQFNNVFEEAMHLWREKYQNIVMGVRCSAHTLQLAVQDGLAKPEYAKLLIEKCRVIVHKLLTQNVLNIIKSRNLKNPIIDNKTRWSSTLVI